MNSISTFSTSFLIKKTRTTNREKTPIVMRITVDGKRREISLNEEISINKWQNGRPKGNTAESRRIANVLDLYSAKARECYTYLIDKNEKVTALKIVQLIRGEYRSDISLLELTDKYIHQIATMIDNGYADATLTRYSTTKRHIERFIKTKYRKKDLSISDLNYDFILRFESYFKKNRKCNHNTTMKYLKNLKAIVNFALKNDWLDKDPFKNFSCKTEPVERDFLTEDEILAIRNLDINIERLVIIRDAFILACYTGLAYVDVSLLKRENIVEGIDGEYWLVVKRKKTNVKSTIPILPIAAHIIKKYLSYTEDLESDRLIPIPSNQKVNAYLKEISTLARIDKNLTFHMARHTFATLALSYKVSIESVSKMLGHKQIRTTQIYAKITEEKISKEMQVMRNIK